MAMAGTLTMLEVCYEETKTGISRQRDGWRTLY